MEGAKRPAGQGVGSVALGGQYVPRGQRVACVFTPRGQKEPRVHGVHADAPEGEKEPCRQGRGARLFAGQAEPAGQRRGAPEEQ